MKLSGIFWQAPRAWLWIGCIGYIVAAFCTRGYYHPDEHYQILEFAGWKTGLIPERLLAWEFAARIRPTAQPWLVVVLLKIGATVGITDTFKVVLGLRLLSGMATFGLLFAFARRVAPDFREPIWLVALVSGLWCMPFLGVRFSSENWSALTLLLGMYALWPYLQTKGSSVPFGRALAIGFIFGWSFWLRFQMAFAFIGLVCWLLWSKRLQWQTWLVMMMGGWLAVGMNVGLDTVFYGEPTLTPWNYFQVNILQDKAAEFGVQPWWWYLPETNRALKIPLGGVLLLLFLTGLHQKRGHVFTWMMLAFVMGHSVIAHKETRFLFPMMFPFLYLAAHGWEYWRRRWQPWTHWKYAIVYALAAFNFFFLVHVNTRPLQPMRLWETLSAIASQQPTTVYTYQQIYPPESDGLTENFFRPPQLRVVGLAAGDTLPTPQTGDLVLLSIPHPPDTLYWQHRPACRIFTTARPVLAQLRQPSSDSTLVMYHAQ